MSDPYSYIEEEDRDRRRYADERTAWEEDASDARFNPLGTTAQTVTRPYLLAHPEREIAEVRWIGAVPAPWCSACGGFIDPRCSMGTTAWAQRFVHEHNALIHPRRAARLTK